MNNPFTVEDAIREWYSAWKAAGSNAALLCKRAPTSIFDDLSNLCSTKMEVLQRAELLLATFKTKTVPAELQLYWAAEADSACSECLMSSSGTVHEECAIKLDTYRKAHNALERLGASLSQ